MQKLAADQGLDGEFLLILLNNSKSLWLPEKNLIYLLYLFKLSLPFTCFLLLFTFSLPLPSSLSKFQEVCSGNERSWC